MEKLDMHFFQPKKFEDIIDTAKIVIDTNVLLAAYQYRNMTFSELIDTLKALNEQKRLLVPSHVLKEFFKNRPQRIVEIIQTVQQVRDGLPNVKEINNIETKIPSLDYLSCNEDIKHAESNLKNAYDEYNKNVKAYKEKLSKLINELKSFFNHDPILVNYSSIFKDSYFSPATLKDEEQILKDFNERVKNSVPPGYKDGKKAQNGEGDYIIWEHILQIKESDVIFISADNKPDWVYKDPDGNVINARRELVEEFYEKSEGKSFCIVHPSVFIKAYNPSVNKEVIEDLNTKLEKNSKFSDLYNDLESLKNVRERVVKSKPLIRELYEEFEHQLNASNEVEGYRMGTHSLLDQALTAISNDRKFYYDIMDEANRIARKNELTDLEKAGQYGSLAITALMNQRDV